MPYGLLHLAGRTVFSFRAESADIHFTLTLLQWFSNCGSMAYHWVMTSFLVDMPDARELQWDRDILLSYVPHERLVAPFEMQEDELDGPWARSSRIHSCNMNE